MSLTSLPVDWTGAHKISVRGLAIDVPERSLVDSRWGKECENLTIKDEGKLIMK